MFSTFTGSSRRPRNVNLSGQASNPFTNTSWSPSVVSNATKTVSDAQAEREKRQVERQRLKAASKIQKTWRGYRSRSSLKEQRRSEFDDFYRSSSDSDVSQRIPIAFNLVLSFFTARRSDDRQRLLLFISDCYNVDLRQLDISSRHPSRLERFVVLLVQALNIIVSTNDTSFPPQHLLTLIDRLASHVPRAITRPINEYYTALAKLCRSKEGGEWPEILFNSLSTPLKVNADGETDAYRALAFCFLTCKDIYLFENNINRLAQAVDAEKLAREIERGYTSGSEKLPTKDDLLWLLAHFIDLSRAQRNSTQHFVSLNALLTQLSALSSDISIRIQPLPEHPGDATQESIAQPLAPYVSHQLLSLVNNEGISSLLREFSASLIKSSNQEFQGTGLLAGYILALLRSFPSRADDTRMRLFLEEIPTATGRIPIVKYLWQMMHQTSVFQKLKTETERPVDVLRRYLGSASPVQSLTIEEQEWRVILLFLELYIFVLRLSDDDDFFSGIYPRVLDGNSSTSRIRSCSLSLQNVEALTTFLKNTGFTLHYKVQEITQTQEGIGASAQSRLDSYWNPAQNSPGNSLSPMVAAECPALEACTKPDLDSLRAIITTSLKMLYERDSRKHFLPGDHWLMTNKLDQQDFVSAVIAEEERQNQEQNEDSDEEIDSTAELSFGSDYGSHSTFASQRLSRHARLERLKVRQVRAQRDRRLAEMGPKLEILKHMPFVVPFETRVMVFRQFIHLDRLRRGGNASLDMHPFAKHRAKIRRDRLFEDAFEQFYQLGEGLKDAIQITFVDQFDTPEAGIDGGGVTKEFLTSVTAEAFGNERGGLGMFTSNEKGLLYPNPIAVDTLRQSLRERGFTELDVEWRDDMSRLLKRFEFLGRIVGKCMYESILVDLAFAGFFLLKWPSPGPKEENSYKGSVNDLQDMDEELYMGLLRLKNYSDDVSALGFDFTVTDQVSAPGVPIQTITRKLIPNGDQVPVTNDNRLLYISYTARHRLVIQPSLQTAAFLRGLRDIIRPSWLSMFNQSELQRLVGGDSTDIDIEDLRRNTVYSGVYEIGDDQQEHPTVKMFWDVMAGFTDAQRRDVLKYVSSTPRAPLLGFSQLKPKFSIRDGGSDEDRLPSTSTCVNLLKLPIYKRESTLREKLLYAVTSGAGFDLS